MDLLILTKIQCGKRNKQLLRGYKRGTEGVQKGYGGGTKGVHDYFPYIFGHWGLGMQGTGCIGDDIQRADNRG